MPDKYYGLADIVYTPSLDLISECLIYIKGFDGPSRWLPEKWFVCTSYDFTQFFRLVGWEEAIAE